jgi:hypothetical protein
VALLENTGWVSSGTLFGLFPGFDTPLKKGIAESGSAEGVRSCNLTDKFAKKFFRGKNVEAASVLM